jgi:hypothetical protein
VGNKLSRATGIFAQDDLRRKIAQLQKEVAEAKAAAARAMLAQGVTTPSPEAAAQSATAPKAGPPAAPAGKDKP